MDDYIQYEIEDEIDFPFPNFNDAIVEVLKWISNFISYFTGLIVVSNKTSFWQNYFILLLCHILLIMQMLHII